MSLADALREIVTGRRRIEVRTVPATQEFDRRDPAPPEPDVERMADEYDDIRVEWEKQTPADCPFDSECPGDFDRLEGAGLGTGWRCLRCDKAFTMYPKPGVVG